MKQRRPVIEGSREVADMHHLRLMSLLQELERAHGRKEAAELLGVDRRTLDISLDEGALSRRMRGALDKALQAGVGSAAAEQRDRNDKLERTPAELKTEGSSDGEAKANGTGPQPKPESTEGGRRGSVLRWLEGAPVNLG